MSPLAGMLSAAALQIGAAVALIGTLARCWRWARTPLARAVPLTPAPRGRGGVWLRVALEIVAFRSLWRATRVGWALGWAFHAALLVVLVDHLWLVLDPVPAVLWRLHSVSTGAGWVLLLALAGLLVRRAAVARVRLISAPSDFLHLVLLGAIAATGVAMRGVHPVDSGAVQAFARAAARGGWPALPPDPVLLAHLAGAALVLLVFPFSKLVHAPAIVFSPSIAAADRARARRVDSCDDGRGPTVRRGA